MEEIIDNEVIESDADTLVQDTEEDGGLYPYDPVSYTHLDVYKRQVQSFVDIVF